MSIYIYLHLSSEYFSICPQVGEETHEIFSTFGTQWFQSHNTFNKILKTKATFFCDFIIYFI
jgi:hypothetical protein